MRLRPPDARHIRRAIVLPIAFALVACGEASEVDDVPKPLAAAAASHEGNTAPRIESASFEPMEPVPGEAVRVVLDIVDDEGDPVKATYEWSLAGESVGAGTAKLMLRDASRGDALQVVVVASDGRADSPPMTVRALVANRAPWLDRILVGPGLEISAGDPVSVEPQGQDDDGDELEFRYAWRVNGEPRDGSGPSFDTSGLDRGDVVSVQVVAHDGSADSEPLTSPEITITNLPPVVTSYPKGSARDRGFRYQLVAEDPDGDASLRFELADAPDGMEIDADSGEVTWTPRPEQAGTHVVHVVVDDGNGGRVDHAFEVAVGGAGPAAVER